jgi:cysteine desulfurase
VQVAKDIAGARARVAEVLGARSSEITFTAGGTEANNLAIQGIMARFPGKKMVTMAIEHDSVLEPAALHDAEFIKPKEDGRLDASELLKAVNDDTVLVSVQYVNNEIGTVQPIREIAAVLKEVRAARKAVGNYTPLYLHTDACQASLYFDLHVARLDVDLMTLNGGKMYGPKQSGILYVAGGTELEPLIRGGGQERNVRSGTENVPAIIGLAKALELAQAGRKTESERLEKLRDMAIKQLESRIPGLEITGSRRFRAPNNVHFTKDGVDNERLLFELDERGIAAAAGSACSASSEEPSHVLKALGCSDAQARSSLRLSFGHDTDEAAIQTLIETLVDLLK